MPNYLYLCENGHEQDEHHRMNQDPDIVCGECGLPMWRKPMGGAGWGRAAIDTYYDWCEVNLHRYRKKQPRFSPDKVNNPDGIPGIDSQHRKRKVTNG